MKKWKFISLVFGLSLGSLAAQVAAPEVVLQNFNNSYPEAKTVKWELTSEGLWQGNFKQEHEQLTIIYEPDGTLRATKWKIKESALPAEVTTSVASKFFGYRIATAERVERQDSGYAYELRLRRAMEDWQVLFSPAGEVIRKNLDEGENKSALREH